eukprot:SAG31_NODE_15434_length_755_cov_1.286585_1_plen_87_part_00
MSAYQAAAAAALAAIATAVRSGSRLGPRGRRDARLCHAPPRSVEAATAPAVRWVMCGAYQRERGPEHPLLGAINISKYLFGRSSST